MRARKFIVVVAGVVLLAGIGGVALFSSKATAALGSGVGSDVPCCQLTTSLGWNALKGDDIPGDEQFFKLKGAPPNVHFIIDTSGSMVELPQVRNSDGNGFINAEPTAAACTATPGCIRGCSNTRLLADEVARGWNGATTYPVPDPGTGIGGDVGFPKLFETNKVYGYEKWDDMTDPSSIAIASVATACLGLHSNPLSSDYLNCISCMNNKGFYHKPGSGTTSPSTNYIFKGNYLNFNPPKYVTARRVLKEIVATVPNIRIGLSRYGSSKGYLVTRQAPNCNLINDGPSQDTARLNLINAANTLGFSGGTPLASTLLNVGQYFSSSNTIYTSSVASGGFNFASSYLNSGTTGGAYTNAALTTEQRSICWGCQTTAVVIISDGEPSGDSNVPATQLSTLNGGAVLYPTQTSDSSDQRLDDVAKVLHERDLQKNSPVTIGQLNTAGTQSLTIYGIGLGLDSPILRNAAEVGGGEYLTAESADELRTAILAILGNISTRATSFSAASVSSLQVNRTGGSVLPRFRPGIAADQTWQGFLYRFELGSERLLTPACIPAVAATILDGGAGDPSDLNGNGDCDDSVLIDKENEPVIEDDQGNFKKYADPTEPGVPYWEAGDVLKGMADGGTPAWQNRNIYTIVDSNGDGKLDKSDTPIAFTEANADALRQYLGISGAASDNRPGDCAALATKLNIAAATTFSGLDCAKTIIRYWRGADALATDPGDRLKDRAFLLGDIFHSAPVVVEPPTPKLFCSFGTQCVETLFKTDTVMDPPKSPTGATDDAYDEYLKIHGDRQKLVIVGANDGMLHAFDNGTTAAGDAGVDPATGLRLYNAGTGRELWGFIPPDALPRLSKHMEGHAYFVDGTAMVREVWLDGTGSHPNDGLKQKGEFRTVAIVGEGEGGVHRFALDLTDMIAGGSSVSGRPPNTVGDFLWTWPQPCDPLATKVGQSSGNFLPNPPPIGAIARRDPAGPLTVNGVKAREQWIVFLNGGYDPYMSRGRGIAMVDIATGTTVWSFFAGDGSTNSAALRYPFHAPISMMDVGQANTPKQDSDLLFDTATIADYGGQVWTIRFWNPGPTDAASTNNWFAARNFQVQITPRATNAAADTDLRMPMTQMTANALQTETGYLRTYVGTGDRNHLIDISGPHCKLSNPYACAALGCQTNTTVSVSRGGALATVLSSMTNTSTMSNYQFGTATNTAGVLGTMCNGAQVKLTWNHNDANSCDVAPVGTNNTGSVQFSCDGIGSLFSCRNTINDWAADQVDFNKTAPTPNPGRFYGYWSYGISTNKIFDTAAQATTYDSNRYNDSNLTDVTQSSVGTIPAANSLGQGWRVSMPNQDESVATGTAIVDGCVIWNTFRPQGTVAAVCATVGSNEGRLYQADFAKGSPNCSEALYVPGTGYAQSKMRNVVAVPGEPTVQRVVIQGVASTGVVTSGAGDFGGYTVTGQKDLLQAVYQLEIDPDEHACRHADAGVDGGTGCQ